MVDKRWLAVFIVACALGLAVGLNHFQLHVYSVCLCSLPTKPSPEGRQLGSLRLCSGGRAGFTYRLYRLKPRASRSNGASNKLWYA